MTDDGTAYGAALDILAQQNKLGKFSLDTMALGPAFDAAAVRSALEEAGLRWTTVNDPAKDIARLLADNKIVAVFAGRMEYGPRALGNRSILGSASDSAINNALNAQLNRTEFMPFAPMTRSEDAAACYENIAGAEHAAEFMTITFRCTPYLKQSCPAVVHVDGTARPQLVVKEKNPFIHAIITAYKELTGRPAIINTSFNVHEEPIVCTPQDAIAGFLDSGLDYLYFDTGQLLSFADNHEAALRHHQNKRRNRSQKEENLTNLVDELWKMMPA
jgi:carbamoyltransferase